MIVCKSEMVLRGLHLNYWEETLSGPVRCIRLFS